MSSASFRLHLVRDAAQTISYDDVLRRSWRALARSAPWPHAGCARVDHSEGHRPGPWNQRSTVDDALEAREAAALPLSPGRPAGARGAPIARSGTALPHIRTIRNMLGRHDENARRVAMANEIRTPGVESSFSAQRSVELLGWNQHAPRYQDAITRSTTRRSSTASNIGTRRQS